MTYDEWWNSPEGEAETCYLLGMKAWDAAESATIARLTAERDDAHRTWETLNELLTKVGAALGLRQDGEVWDSWHDMAERVSRLLRVADAARKINAVCEHRIATGCGYDGEIHDIVRAALADCDEGKP